jgi:hypothetical protein
VSGSLKTQEEKDNLGEQLENINKRWALLRKKSLEIRSRLESNSSQWSALLNSLKELIQWCKNQQNEIVLRKKNLQPDLALTSKQIVESKVSSFFVFLFYALTNASCLFLFVSLSPFCALQTN